MFEAYYLSFWGLWLIGATILLQSLVAAIAHRKQSQYVPGIVDNHLSHESFVFRSHRTFMNSIENVSMMLIPVVIGLLTRMDPTWLASLIWVYAVARLIHMVLYYLVATEKNPSPRSYFYTIALLSNLVLYVMLGLHLA